ncbi:hypothetical protein ADL15_22145 [Actinoplanes awajinensis subsp. mycoplanecinus]|uniref:Uncharacterized protein n=2 Tax=Actinoplanes awajinensis TaxID=135946 RepID=A0A101JQY8_9ACTN|nr:hypothetical protein ADL15_22145 [Actinoplanes awajinensis subsp. mycoplanecinus]
MKNLTAAADAAGSKLSEAELGTADIGKLLDDLVVATTSAVRTLPPDTSVKVLRRYTGEDGRAMIEIEIDLDDDLVAYLDTVPDRNAFIDEALCRAVNASTLGRHAYRQNLNVAARKFGLSVGWGADLDVWMDHYPKPPRRLTAEILAAHAQRVRRQADTAGRADTNSAEGRPATTL